MLPTSCIFLKLTCSILRIRAQLVGTAEVTSAYKIMPPLGHTLDGEGRAGFLRAGIQPPPMMSSQPRRGWGASGRASASLGGKTHACKH
jgi:hypothetical protein